MPHIPHGLTHSQYTEILNGGALPERIDSLGDGGRLRYGLEDGVVEEAVPELMDGDVEEFDFEAVHGGEATPELGGHATPTGDATPTGAQSELGGDATPTGDQSEHGDDIAFDPHTSPPQSPVADAPPVPPPPIAIHSVHQTHWVDVRGDGLCYFKHDTVRKKLNAHCMFPTHGRLCRAGRALTAHPKAPRVKPQQGRPGGTLLAWINCAAHFEDATAHMMELTEPFLSASPHFTPQLRSDVRDLVEGQFPEFSQFLSEVERPPEPGEGSEPAAPT